MDEKILQVPLKQSEFNQHLLGRLFIDKRALIIVPHQDDEIIIAGSMILNMRENHCEVFLLFTTNGDYEIDGKIRLNETLNAMKKLGVRGDHIIYLGYSNQNPKEDSHIYFHEDKEPWTSVHGETETYGYESHTDYRFSVDGIHSKFTKTAFIQDIKDAIIHIQPDFLFVIDFDYHPDHRCASLAFDKAMGEILKKSPNYSPVVYKTFAYPTSFLSEMDYSPYNLSSTLYKREAFSKYALSNPAYSWSDRVRYPVPDSARTKFLKNNQIYRALRDYKSQNAVAHAESILNSDQIFWRRRTDSISYRCTVETSSGKCEYLNDFMLFDCKSIMHGDTEYPVFSNCSWIPDETDLQKSVRFILPSPTDMGEIVFYEGCDEIDRVEKIKILFSNGVEIVTDDIQHDGQPTRLSVESQANINWIEIQIIQSSGINAGFSEIEIYKKEKEVIDYIKIMVNGSFVNKYFSLKQFVFFDIYVQEKFNRFHSLPDEKFVFFTIDEKGNKEILQERLITLNHHSKITVCAQLKENFLTYDSIDIVRINPLQVFHISVYRKWIRIKITMEKVKFIIKEIIFHLNLHR